MDELHYLFCALGNGSLCYFDLNIETGTLCKKGEVSISNSNLSFTFITNLN